jgi:hypothetical protein
VRSPPPPSSGAADAFADLDARGWAVVDAAAFAAVTGADVAGLAALAASWHHLPRDAWLKDGGSYRARRHACFVVDGDAVERVEHRPHWQSLDYNALHGGLERWFAPIDDAVGAAPAWTTLLRGLGGLASRLQGRRRWFVEAHQFRIDTKDGIGRPTPEGAHRDGVDLVVVVLVDRQGIKGGETRVFDADGNAGVRFTLDEPWSALLLDDARVIHETTPLQPRSADVDGHRDTLVLTFRKGAFQGPGT